MQVGDFEIGGESALKTIHNLDRGFGEMFGKLSKYAGIFAGSFAAFEGVAAVAEKFKETIDLGSELQDLSTQTQESVGDLVILRQAFANAGLGASNTGDFLLKLQDSIAGVNEEGRSTAGALEQLHTSAEELRALPAIGQIKRLQDGLKDLDQTAKVQVAKDLFGKSGGKALSLLSDPEAIGQAQGQAGSTASIMSENAAAFDSLGDSIAALKNNVYEFFGGALSQLAPTFTKLADAMNSIDFRSFGEGFAQLLKPMLAITEAIYSMVHIINKMGDGIHQMLVDFGLLAKTKPIEGLTNLALRNSSAAPGNGALINSLQKVGGGGGFGIGGGGDPLLSESRRQTQLLNTIAANTQRTDRPGPKPVSVLSH